MVSFRIGKKPPGATKFRYIDMKKGTLSNFGYRTRKPTKSRQAALRRAVNGIKSKDHSSNNANVKKGNAKNKVLRKLVLLRTLHRRNPSVAKRLDQDVKFIQKTYGHLIGKRND